MRERFVRKVLQVARHRNGISGAPFYAVLFQAWERGVGLMVGIVHDEPGYCSVLRVEPLSAPVGVTFGVNSWRGDTFEPELRAAIGAWEAAESGRYTTQQG